MGSDGRKTGKHVLASPAVATKAGKAICPDKDSKYRLGEDSVGKVPTVQGSQYPQTELGALVMSLSWHGTARPHS